MDPTTQRLLAAIHRKAMAYGYSQGCISRATGKALDMRPAGQGLSIQPCGGTAVEVWAELLLDEAARETAA